MSGDVFSRSILFDERIERLRKRKKWVQNLSILSSEEENSDEVRPDIKIDTSQLIALRFPYPMISDDSDDDEDLKYFPVDLNTCVLSDKKRKHVSSSDEGSNHAHTKEKIVCESKRHKIHNEDLFSNDTPSLQDNGKSTCTPSSDITHPSSDEEQFKHNSYYKPTKSSYICSSSSSSDSTNENSEYLKKKRKVNQVNTRAMSKNTSSVGTIIKNLPESSYQSNFRYKINVTKNSPDCETIRTSHNTTEFVQKFNQTVDKEDKDEYAKSRFLHSSSENTDEEMNYVFNKRTLPKSKSNRSSRFRRLHVISPSSSDCDETVVNEIQHDSNKSSLPVTINRPVQSKSRNISVNHMMSSSSEEDMEKDLVTTENKSRNQALPQTSPKETHPCHNLLQNFNTTNSQKLENEEEKIENNSKENKPCKPNTVSKTSNPNSTAWKHFATLPIKQKTTSSKPTSKVKLKDLKKKFASSNVSSVEIHKKIQNMALRKNRNSKPSSSGIKNNNNKGSVGSIGDSKDICNEHSNTVQVKNNFRLNEIGNAVQSNSERRQPLEHKYTVNVNVYCNSSQGSEIENIRNPDNLHLRPADEKLTTTEQSELDIDLMMQNNTDDIAVSEHSKKIRISRMNQGAVRKDHQNKPSIYDNNPQQSKKTTHKETEKVHENKEIQNNSNQCDVLGSILSEMEKNPYKIERPIKKAADTITDDFGWSPNPLIFGTNKQSYITETNSSITAKIGHQTELPSASLNKTGAIEPSTFPSNNSYLTTPSKSESSKNSFTPSSDMKTQQKCTGSSDTRDSVIVQFYSADSKEYASKSIEKVNLDQKSRTSLEDVELSKTKRSNKKVSVNEENKQTNNRQSNSKKGAFSNNKLILSNKIPIESKICADFTDKKSITESIVGDQVKIPTNTKSLPVASKEATTRSSAQVENKNSDNGNTAGIRIKLFGTIYRLPGKETSSTISNRSSKEESTNSSSNKTRVISSGRKKLNNNNNSFNSNTFSRPTSSPIMNTNTILSENSDSSNSEESDTSSDSSDSEESSSDSSDSSESSNSQAEVRLAKEVTTVLPTQQCSTEKVLSLNESTSGLNNSATLNDGVTKKPNECQSSNDEKVPSLNESTSGLYNSITLNDGVTKKPSKYPSSNNEKVTSLNESTSGLYNSVTLNDGVTKKPSKYQSSNNEKVPSLNESTSGLNNSATLNDGVTKKPNECQSSNDEKVPSLNESTSGLYNSVTLNDGVTKKPSKCQSSNNEKVPSLNESTSGLNNSATLNDGVTKKPSECQSSNHEKVPSLNESTSGLDSSATLNYRVTKKPINCQSNNDDVIVLSDSSDSENNIGNDDTTKHNVTDNIDHSEDSLASKTIDNNNDSSSNFVGKIRVRSLRDLGVNVEQSPPENALPTVPLVLPTVVSSKLPNVHKTKHGFTKNPSLCETSRTHLVQNSNSNLTLHVKSNNQLNANTESTQNSVVAQFCKPPPFIESISKVPQSQCNAIQICNLSNTSTVSKEAETVIKKLPIVQALPNQIKENISPQQSSSDTETLFFGLCDTLFIDIVHLKIPKLVDDLHLSILHDKIKEERLKKLDQLISAETIASEKRRAEKDFAEMIRVRSHSFVPLLMTIVKKITKDNFITLVIALYCRIVYQLERIEPANSEYRFKLKDIIKFMLQKHNSPEIENLISVFNCDESTFISYFNFVETLLRKYDLLLEERQRQAQQKQNETDNNQSSSVIEECQRQTQQNHNVSNNNQSSNKNSGNISLSKTTVDKNSSNPPQVPNTPIRLVPVSNDTSNGTLIVAVLQTNDAKANPANVPRSDRNQLQPSSNASNSTSSTPAPPNSLIGNLDSILFKKTSIANKISR